MAKLICKDGTEIQIPDEAEQALRDKFEKKIFKKRIYCHLGIDVSSGTILLIWDDDKDVICVNSPDSTRRIIEGLQLAIDFVEQNR